MSAELQLQFPDAPEVRVEVELARIRERAKTRAALAALRGESDDSAQRLELLAEKIERAHRARTRRGAR